MKLHILQIRLWLREPKKKTIDRLTEINFFDLEEGVLRAVANVGGCNHVDSSTDAAMVNGGNHRFVALERNVQFKKKWIKAL